MRPRARVAGQQVFPARAPECRGEVPGVFLVPQAQRLAPAAHARVEPGRRAGQRLCVRLPGPHHGFAASGQPRVPDVEGVQQLGVGRDVLEQRVALGERAAVFRKNRGAGRAELADGRVDEIPAPGRAAAQQREVLRRKDRRAELPDHRGARPLRHAVELRGPSARRNADLRGLPAPAAVKIQPQAALRAAGAHHLGVLRAAERALPGEEPHALQQVGLALRVPAPEHVDAPARAKLAGSEVAEVQPGKAQDFHARATS